MNPHQYRHIPEHLAERLWKVRVVIHNRRARARETCRSFYNDCLAERKETYEKAGTTIGKFEQLRHVKERKATNPYAARVHSHILQVVVADLDKAFQNFFRRVKAGETPGYP